ncbi:hypothetical protein HK099_004623 [Clydaea vesicula]|uniref:Uncharacterized protein n=1 Tax=Clydaea vesicula TaxID=447962 RepID=A0AAD5U0G7_9FUNG|nr:hypothetical protein HK099_004623 [Clydaea vesicula]
MSTAERQVPGPLCFACKEDEAWYDEARKVYSKYCQLECQQIHSDYMDAVFKVKKCVEKKPLIIDDNDFPPPKCSCPNMGNKNYDYIQKKYLDTCRYCDSKAVKQYQHNPQNFYPQQSQNSNAVVSNQPQFQQSTGSSHSYLNIEPTPQKNFPRPLQLNRTVRGSPTAPPTESASRPSYQQSKMQDRNGLCSHCYLNPTYGGNLFCNNQCEQAEGRVKGCGILVTNANFEYVVLVFMANGVYKGLWSIFHDAKGPHELSRVKFHHFSLAYSMVEHSTPHVFSYTVLVQREQLPRYLPASNEVHPQAGQFAYIRIDQFRTPLTPENGIYVMDINHKQRKVSRQTHKVILEFIKS